MNGKLRCVAIDDEPMALLVIEQFCRRRGDIDIVSFSEPRIGMAAILREKPDLVFLDVEMGDVSGLEIAEKLKNECNFIFTTAFAEYAIDGFNLDAVDFLHKPFPYERFGVAVDKVWQRVALRRGEPSGCIVVKQEYNNVTIPLSDIMYIEALGNYVKIVRVSGGHVLTRTNLKSITDMLPENAFVRIHRSYVVSLSSVLSFNRTRVVLKGHDEGLPVGAQYADVSMEIMSRRHSGGEK